MFSLLVGFVNREGTAQVPQDHIEGGFNLGGWVSSRRAEGRSGRLSIDRVEQLEALNGWTWHQVDLRWEHSYSCLKTFIEVNGTAQVPQDYVVENVSLGSWVSNQRTEYRSGRIPSDRVERLEALPGWMWNSIEDRWNDAYTLLKGFIAREGHANVSQNQIANGINLGRWVSKQRASNKGGKLSSERVKLLEDLPGWAWDALSSQWEDGFTRLKVFSEREGHTEVPKNHIEDGLNLGSWVSTQKLRKRDRKISAERIARLESLNSWVWDSDEERWERGFSVLKMFVDREGHARVPAKYSEDEFNLGIWCDNQRGKYRGGTLSKGRTERLEGLDQWSWNPRNETWEDALGVLRKIVERTGSVRIAESHVEEGLNAASWIGSRRIEYRKGKLSEERIAQLELLPGWTWDPHSELWEQGFTSLSKYVALYGTSQVPAKHVEDEFRLGSWVNTQRTKYRSGKLAPDRVERLEALPSWAWSLRD
jgi:hypothetical protein